MYDRIRISFDRNSDPELLAMFNHSITTLSNKKGWRKPGICPRD